MRLRVAPLPPSPVPQSLLDDAQTLTGAFAELVGRFPDYEGLIFLDRSGREERISMARLWQRARDIQAALLARRLPPGATVLLILPTGLELTAAYVGAILAGGVPAILSTPFNRYADRRVYVRHIAPILALSRAHAVYCTDEVAEIFRTHDELAAGRDALLLPAEVEAGANPPPAAAAAPGDIAMIQYSSGSTAVPKGVLLTHRAVLNNLRSTRDGFGQTARDVSVNWIPLYHDMGLIDSYLRPLLGGCPTVLIPTGEFLRQPAVWLWGLDAYRGTISLAPNFAYMLCASRLSEDEIAGLDLSSWRIAVNGSEPCLAHTIDAFTQRFAPLRYDPAAMTPVWGMAETVCIATAEPIGVAPRVETIDRRALAVDGVARPASSGMSSVSIGRCLPGCQVEIRDDRGTRLGDRTVGVIWLHSDCLFSGYQRQPELTAQALVDGWFNTGDRGYTADGHLYFISRQKDLIVIAGEKYAPHDVETAIDRVAGVREGCAVAFGVLNEARGTEDVVAVVETRAESAHEQDALREAIRAAVTTNTGLALRHVVLVPPGGIEKTTSGKLARGATRERYADALPA
jgi:acyl-CoA synthetase (AMP-forming)/AMP-acid ligase II